MVNHRILAAAVAGSVGFVDFPIPPAYGLLPSFVASLACAVAAALLLPMERPYCDACPRPAARGVFHAGLGGALWALFAREVAAPRAAPQQAFLLGMNAACLTASAVFHEVWAAGRLRQRCRRAAPSCSESSPRARPLAPDLSADRAPPDGSARHSHGGDGRRDRFRRPAELHEGPPRLPALRPRQVLRPARARRPHASARAPTPFPPRRFFQDGCENCPFLELAERQDRVASCTTASFDGVVAMMKPEESWIARWEGINRSLPGCYAMKLTGEMPEQIRQFLHDKRISSRVTQAE